MNTRVRLRVACESSLPGPQYTSVRFRMQRSSPVSNTHTPKPGIANCGWPWRLRRGFAGTHALLLCVKGEGRGRRSDSKFKIQDSRIKNQNSREEAAIMPTHHQRQNAVRPYPNRPFNSTALRPYTNLQFGPDAHRPYTNPRLRPNAIRPRPAWGHHQGRAPLGPTRECSHGLVSLAPVGMSRAEDVARASRPLGAGASRPCPVMAGTAMARRT